MGLYFPDPEPSPPSRVAIARHAAGKLLRLDAEFIEACRQRDGEWLSQHLSEDFRGVLRDGALVDRDGFIAATVAAQQVDAGSVEDATVRFEGDTALVHSSSGSGDIRERATDIWVGRDGRWQLLALQRTAMAGYCSVVSVSDSGVSSGQVLSGNP